MKTPSSATTTRTRFADAWAAAEYAAEHLDVLEKKTRRFAAAMRESTIPAAIKDAASANLSTLVDPRLLPHRRWRIPRLRRRQRPRRLLPRKLRPRLELRDRHGPHLPELRPLAARLRFRLPARRQGRHPLPRASSPQRRQLRLRRGRRPDGPDHARLSRLAAFRRHRVAARNVAAHQEGHRVRLDPGRLGRRQRRRARRACSTTPTTWSSTAPTRNAASSIWERFARVRRWRVRWATAPARRSIAPCSSAAASGSTPTSSTASSTYRKSAASPRTRSRPTWSATWARPTPRPRNTRWAAAACSIS